MIGTVLIIPLVTAFLCYSIRNRKAIEYLNLSGAVLTTAAAIPPVTAAVSAPFYGLGGMFYMDSLSSYIMGIVVLISLLSSIYSLNYMGREFDDGVITMKDLRHYYTLMHMFIFTMLLTTVCNNLAVFWIAVEGTTLVSALLVGFYRNKQSIEAAWKYIILCTVGITLALLGIFIVYYASAAASGGRGTLNWTELRDMAHALNPATMKLAFVFILVGYGAKAGLAPVHNWLPDAHSQAPTPISAMLSGVLLKCSFIGIVRFLILVDASTGNAYGGRLMLIFGLLSMGIATAFILLQTNYKRLLAYSSVEHIGIIATGVGIGGFWGMYGALLHMLNHAIVKTLLFFTTGNVRLRYHSTKIENIRGAMTRMPVAGTIMLLAALAIAGAPPFSIFLSEFIILKASVESGNWIAFVLFLLFAAIIFAGVLHHFGSMAFGGTEAGTEQEGKMVGLVLVVMAAVMLMGGLHIPAFLEKLLSNSATIMAGV